MAEWHVHKDLCNARGQAGSAAPDAGPPGLGCQWTLADGPIARRRADSNSLNSLLREFEFNQVFNCFSCQYLFMVLGRLRGGGRIGTRPGPPAGRRRAVAAR